MRLIVAVTVAAVLILSPAAQTVGQSGGYAGQQDREIKALSAGETADLAAGRGMGMARAGELNHYPGPAHALELQDRLGLTPAQLEAVQASFGRMQAAAKPLGGELVRRERALDEAFRVGTATTADVAASTDRIGALQGQLRAVHLAAHLETRSILRPEQIATYDALRGYSGVASEPASGQAHRMHPG